MRPPPFGAGWKRAVRDASAPLLGRAREARFAVGAIETIPDTVFFQEAPSRIAPSGARKGLIFAAPAAGTLPVLGTRSLRAA